MTKSMLIFSFFILVIAVLTKVLGCGLGAWICRYSRRESLNVGIGMISRGEVALIVAQKRLSHGLAQWTIIFACGTCRHCDHYHYPGAAEKIYEINGINTTLIERNYDTPAILLKSVKSTPEFNYKRRKALRK